MTGLLVIGRNGIERETELDPNRESNIAFSQGRLLAATGKPLDSWYRGKPERIFYEAGYASYQDSDSVSWLFFS